MKIDTHLIKNLRKLSGAGISDCKEALVKVQGDFDRALEILKKKGAEIAAKKAQREVGQGLIETYVHAGGKVAAMVEVACETDFVARTDEFKNLAHELAMQICAMDPKDISELLHQEYIRDSEKKVEELVKETIAKVGENIKIVRFIRFDFGR